MKVFHHEQFALYGLLHTGWQYCIEAGLGGWVASERTVHMCRRRRWVRTRRRLNKPKVDPKVAEKKVKSLLYYLTSLS